MKEAFTCSRWTKWVWKITGWSSRLHENYQSFLKNIWNIPQIDKEKPKDVNMQPDGSGNTRTSTDYAQKCPQTQFSEPVLGTPLQTGAKILFPAKSGEAQNFKYSIWNQCGTSQQSAKKCQLHAKKVVLLLELEWNLIFLKSVNCCVPGQDYSASIEWIDCESQAGIWKAHSSRLGIKFNCHYHYYKR